MVFNSAFKRLNLIKLDSEIIVSDKLGRTERDISLRAGRSGDQNPFGTKFSAFFQTGPGSHLASNSMGTLSFSGIKRPDRGIDHPPASSAEVKESV